MTYRFYQCPEGPLVRVHLELEEEAQSPREAAVLALGLRVQVDVIRCVVTRGRTVYERVVYDREEHGSLRDFLRTTKARHERDRRRKAS